MTGVLLDLSLPDSHGMETFKRTREQAPEVPIVVLTGNDDDELGLQAVREGAQDYIVKGHLKGSGLARAIKYAIERKSVDAKLRRAKEMEAIGHMSAGMAKDINNVLAVILMNLQSLEWPLRNDEVLAGKIRAARRAVYLGANLTKRLASLAASDSFSKKTTDVNRLITEMADLLSDVTAKGSAVVMRLVPTVLPVRVNPLDLETALISLVSNARESMATGGRVTLATENVTVEDGDYPENDVGQGSYVMLSVSDIGVGMSEKQRQNAIEPFYSTKPGAEGHGLGLSMVSGFVRRSGGFMRIVSEDGAGTSVELFLPSASAPATAPKKVDPMTELANGETVLVFGPDNSVCEAIAMQLEELGYTAIQADTSAGALELLETYAETEIVLIDILASETFDAQSLANEFMAIRPGLKVLYTSACGRQTIEQIGIPDDVENVLFKPYRKSDLAKKMRELLDE